MGWLWDSIKYVYAYLAVIPVIPFALVYFGHGLFSEDRKKAMQLAMDVTTALLIGCVAVLFDSLFNSHFGLYAIILIMLLAGGMLGNMQFRKRGSVNVRRIVKAVWRLGFFTMSMAYLLLMFIAIGKKIFAA